MSGLLDDATALRLADALDVAFNKFQQLTVMAEDLHAGLPELPQIGETSLYEEKRNAASLTPWYPTTDYGNPVLTSRIVIATINGVRYQGSVYARPREDGRGMRTYAANLRRSDTYAEPTDAAVKAVAAFGLRHAEAYHLTAEVITKLGLIAKARTEVSTLLSAIEHQRDHEAEKALRVMREVLS